MRNLLFQSLLALQFILPGWAWVERSDAQTNYFPPLTGAQWETLSPQTLGWQTDSLESLKMYLGEKGSRAFIILKDGRIVVEWYYGTFTRDSLWYWASAGKTITSFLIGKAQEEEFLQISQRTSDFLGKGWSSAPPDKEELITIRHQMTMTTGLNDRVSDTDCTAASCLLYLSDAGTRWAYHNAPYTLLGEVLEAATGLAKNIYTATRLRNRIGMKGLWITTGDNVVYYSDARSMARFGLLMSNNAVWEADTLLHDQQFLQQSVHTSQPLNPSYGYLWWLNGKGAYMLPQSQILFNGNLVPSAPPDLIAALGKNDQKIYIVKSLGLVVVRMGESAAESHLALSSFDNELWLKIMQLGRGSTGVERVPHPTAAFQQPGRIHLAQNYPNPFNGSTMIRFTLSSSGPVLLQIFDQRGRETARLHQGHLAAGEQVLIWNAEGLASGLYLYRITTAAGTLFGKALLMR